ncbi:MAG: DUF87 domain-containing protein [Candidatus Nanoarchaeia archaeon]
MKVSIGTVVENKKEFELPVNELLTGRTALIAQSGAGKSWLIGVICEKLSKINAGFCLIDTEGEYYSLKEKFDLLWVANNKNADLDIATLLTKNLEEFCEKIIDHSISVIFDVSEILNSKEAVAMLAKNLFSAASKIKKPYLLIIEEADKFIPQNKDSLKEVEEISKRGRKRGLGLLIATQRPSIVNKNVLSQCNNQILGKLTIENDLKAVDLFFSSRKELEDLPKLNPGEFFVMGFNQTKTKIRSAERETFHSGFTPTFSPKKFTNKEEILKTFYSKTIEPANGFQNFVQKEVKNELKKEDIAKIIEKIRKKVFSKEKITKFEKVAYPLVFLKIKFKKGLVFKQISEGAIILDGLTGEFFDVKNIKKSEGFSKLLNFDESEITILMNLHKKTTISELEAKTDFSKEKIRKILKSLKDKGAATETQKIKNVLIWETLLHIKKPKLNQKIELNFEFEKPKGKILECKLSKEKIREIIKAFEPTAELVSFDVFYWPMWDIILSNKKQRKFFIDGVNGRIFSK